MCSECDLDGATCGYCGDECYGTCGDPDTCGSCWADKHYEYDVDDGGEALDYCLDSSCNCVCHADLYDELDIRFEAGVMFHIESNRPLYKRKGVFPFLTLPGEIRDKIYGYAMLQEGQQRASGSHYHRGTIHTAVLQACRQINKEAKHVPLTINKLCFDGPLNALHFFACRLPSTVSSLVTAIHVEYHVHNPQYEIWNLLIKELIEMNITHLGLTIFGPLRKDLIVGHTCFANRFIPLSNLRSVDLQLGSAFITEKDRIECLEFLKKQLIQGYDVSHKGSPELKRTATDDGHQSKEGKKAAKVAKKNTSGMKPMKRSTRSSAVADAKSYPKYHAQMRLQAKLSAEFTQLKTYATSLNLSLVSIRLEAARKAMEAADKQKFETLARGIWDTLENHYSIISDVRKNILISSFMTRSDPLTE